MDFRFSVFLLIGITQIMVHAVTLSFPDEAKCKGCSLPTLLNCKITILCWYNIHLTWCDAMAPGISEIDKTVDAMGLMYR
jgi:hypothetical protein